MTPEQFCYWLQGAFEILPDNMELDITQLQVIKDHLATVFTKVTPERREPTYCKAVIPQEVIQDFNAQVEATQNKLNAGTLNTALFVEEIERDDKEKDKLIAEQKQAIADSGPFSPITQNTSPWPISQTTPRAWPST